MITKFRWPFLLVIVFLLSEVTLCFSLLPSSSPGEAIWATLNEEEQRQSLDLYRNAYPIQNPRKADNVHMKLWSDFIKEQVGIYLNNKKEVGEANRQSVLDSFVAFVQNKRISLIETEVAKAASQAEKNVVKDSFRAMEKAWIAYATSQNEPNRIALEKALLTTVSEVKRFKRKNHLDVDNNIYWMNHLWRFVSDEKSQQALMAFCVESSAVKIALPDLEKDVDRKTAYEALLSFYKSVDVHAIFENEQASDWMKLSAMARPSKRFDFRHEQYFLKVCDMIVQKKDLQLSQYAKELANGVLNINLFNTALSTYDPTIIFDDIELTRHKVIKANGGASLDLFFSKNQKLSQTEQAQNWLVSAVLADPSPENVAYIKRYFSINTPIKSEFLPFNLYSAIEKLDYEDQKKFFFLLSDIISPINEGASRDKRRAIALKIKEHDPEEFKTFIDKELSSSRIALAFEFFDGDEFFTLYDNNSKDEIFKNSSKNRSTLYKLASHSSPDVRMKVLRELAKWPTWQKLPFNSYDMQVSAVANCVRKLPWKYLSEARSIVEELKLTYDPRVKFSGTLPVMAIIHEGVRKAESIYRKSCTFFLRKLSKNTGIKN